jgi:hypothetical protein
LLPAKTTDHPPYRKDITMNQQQELELMEAEASFHESLSEASRVIQTLNVDSFNVSFTSQDELYHKARVAYYDLLKATIKMMECSVELFEVLCNANNVPFKD